MNKDVIQGLLEILIIVVFLCMGSGGGVVSQNDIIKFKEIK